MFRYSIVVIQLCCLFTSTHTFPSILSALAPSFNTSVFNTTIINFTNAEDVSLNSEANHLTTIDRQNSAFKIGQSLSLGITNAITRPLTLFNNHVSSAAGALPGLFAAGGAGKWPFDFRPPSSNSVSLYSLALGTAIATPIQMGALAANSFVTGATGTLVSVPISLVSGGTAQLVGLLYSGRQFLQSAMGSQEVLQPLAVVAGTNSILAGVGANYLGSGLKLTGQQVEQFGLSVSSAGQQVKHYGSALLGWVNGQPVYLNQTKATDDSSRPIVINAYIPFPFQKAEVPEMSTLAPEPLEATTAAALLADPTEAVKAADPVEANTMEEPAEVQTQGAEVQALNEPVEVQTQAPEVPAETLNEPTVASLEDSSPVTSASLESNDSLPVTFPSTSPDLSDKTADPKENLPVEESTLNEASLPPTDPTIKLLHHSFRAAHWNIWQDFYFINFIFLFKLFNFWFIHLHRVNWILNGVNLKLSEQTSF